MLQNRHEMRDLQKQEVLGKDSLTLFQRIIVAKGNAFFKIKTHLFIHFQMKFSMKKTEIAPMFLVAARLFLLFAAAPALASTVTWTGGGDGTSWNSAANWGGTLPGVNDDAVIPVTSGNSTVQFTSAAGIVQVKSLTTSKLMTFSGGTLQVATTFQTSQNITLAGGTIKGGTVSATGGAVLTATSGALDGLALNE